MICVILRVRQHIICFLTGIRSESFSCNQIKVRQFNFLVLLSYNHFYLAKMRLKSELCLLHLSLYLTVGFSL